MAVTTPLPTRVDDVIVPLDLRAALVLAESVVTSPAVLQSRNVSAEITDRGHNGFRYRILSHLARGARQGNPGKVSAVALGPNLTLVSFRERPTTALYFLFVFPALGVANYIASVAGGADPFNEPGMIGLAAGAVMCLLIYLIVRLVSKKGERMAVALGRAAAAHPSPSPAMSASPPATAGLA
jgi:hypothetical protein